MDCTGSDVLRIAAQEKVTLPKHIGEILIGEAWPAIRRKSYVALCEVGSTEGAKYGGESGIRTHGPVRTGQRFSRPPHSTALPSLLAK